MKENERRELDDVRSRLDAMVEYRLLYGWTIEDHKLYRELTATESLLLSGCRPAQKSHAGAEREAPAIA